MHLATLEVHDFRSYQQARVEFDPGVTILVGANGQGKTNLVEAVGYLATLGSHRVASDAPLVRQGATSALIRAEVASGERQVRVEVELNPGRANRARVNGAPLTRARDLLGVVQRVLFAPEDLAIVKGDPAGRRTYLDEVLVSLSPRMAGIRSDLERVLKQRNSLLKSASQLRGGGAPARKAAVVTLSVWDEQFVSLCTQLLIARIALAARLADPVAANYAAVAPGTSGRAVLRYACSVPGVGDSSGAGEIAELLRAELARRQDEEFNRGVTLVGPHRDDLVLEIGGLPVRGYASHGESWSMALALRLASYDIALTELHVAGAPILILDDVFAELDDSRRRRLAELVGRAEQVLVTAAVPGDVPVELRGATLEVHGGQVVPGRANTVGENGHD